MTIRNIIRKIAKALVYFSAAIVILLAVAVGLFRLLLPQLPEYQNEIKAWANAAIGMQVEFSDMRARWRLSGPELSFDQANLSASSESPSLLSVAEVSVGVSLLRLLRDREFVVDRIEFSGTEITIQHSENDGWLVQGIPADQIISRPGMDSNQSENVIVVAEDVTVNYLLPDSSDMLSFSIVELEMTRSDARSQLDAVVELPLDMGQRIRIGASQTDLNDADDSWQIFVEANGLNLPAWRELTGEQIAVPELQTGMLDLSGSVRYSANGFDHATADFVINNFQGGDPLVRSAVDVQGRIEYSRDTSGWLVAASKFELSTVESDWPPSSFGVQVSEDGEGEVQAFSVTASYLNLDDFGYFQEWMPQNIRDQLAKFSPSGVLQDLRLGLLDLTTDSPQYDVSAEMLGAGLAAVDDYPGFRELSGIIRMDNSGGRLELNSSGLIVDLQSQLPEPIAFDDAIGTVIWRRNSSGTIILSDSIRIRNADLDSESSLQISLPIDDGSPVVDLRSDWSLNDVAQVKRYLPSKVVKPRLYRWLDLALVSGDVPKGSFQLTGPLDKFPFDNGEGVFKAQARLENTTLRYNAQWPDVRNMTLDVFVDGARLYSNRNTSGNAGNSVVNAKIEIADLRKPILTIDAFATGSLLTIQDFVRGSPIANVFGEHLDLITVSGDASFNLEMTFPIAEPDQYDFVTRIQTNGGTLTMDGFTPALTELNGIVEVSRDEINSESLFATFLGEQINIDLHTAGDALPGYNVVADAQGTITSDALIAELAPALQGILGGSSQYNASLQFPRSGEAEPATLQLIVNSNLEGMYISLPTPLLKTAETIQPLLLELQFPEVGRVDGIGKLGDQFAWSASILKDLDLGWDFDRGTLAIGGNEPSIPETRGLHIIGAIDEIRFEDWLALSRGQSEKSGVVDRIRSIDVSIGSLSIIGQDLVDHDVVVHRSAEDWLVSISGALISGSLTVPYDFSSGRTLIADMETLLLPGSSEPNLDVDSEATFADPRKAPAISVRAEEFSLGERALGTLTAEFETTETGLRSTLLATADPTFTVVGSASWLADSSSETGQRTHLDVSLVSKDIRKTMSRLKYEPGIKGDDLQIDLDLVWPGGPREDFLAAADGEIALRLGKGQLDDVKPGAGRVFGLMSVVALPRRLSLDFRDVFDKGLGFDQISGSFRIENGQAYTCDLSLEGPAADIGIVGRAGLTTRDYEQTAVVSANVGNTLPIVGGLVAGPQVAAALLIFSQIFKKPLQGVGQVYYGIDGSWDDPSIDTVKFDRFDQNSLSAGCIEPGE